MIAARSPCLASGVPGLMSARSRVIAAARIVRVRGHAFPSWRRFRGCVAAGCDRPLCCGGDAAAPLPVLGPRAALRSGSACHRMSLGSGRAAWDRGLGWFRKLAVAGASLRCFGWSRASCRAACLEFLWSPALGPARPGWSPCRARPAAKSRQEAPESTTNESPACQGGEFSASARRFFAYRSVFSVFRGQLSGGR